MNIRQATINDLEAVFHVESNCFLPSEAASKENLEKRIIEFSQGFLVAEINQEIVGILNCGCTNKEDISDEELKSLIGHDPNGKFLVIFGLAVLPDFRKKGIPFKLMDSLKEKFPTKSGTLLLCKKTLVPYYEKYGFINQGLSNSTHGGFSWFQMKYLF